MRFGNLHFRDHWGEHVGPTAVRMWLICSNRRWYHKIDLFDTMTLHNNRFVIDFPTIFTAQIIHSYICTEEKYVTLSHRSKRRPTPFKNALNEISRKSNLNRAAAVRNWTKFPSNKCTTAISERHQRSMTTSARHGDAGGAVASI